MSSEDAKVVEAELVDRTGQPVDLDVDYRSDSEWARSDKSGRAQIRRMLNRLAPDWSRANPADVPAYVKLTPSLANHIHLELPSEKVSEKQYRRRVMDEVLDRLLHIMVYGSDENAVKVVKMLLEHVDPPMTKTVTVDTPSAKVLVLPPEVSDLL